MTKLRKNIVLSFREFYNSNIQLLKLKSNVIIVLFFTLFFSINVSAQSRLQSKKLFFETDEYLVLKKNYQVDFKDSLSLISYVKDLKYFAVKKGYLTASIDTLYSKKDSVFVRFFVGEKFTKMKITMDDSDLKFLKNNVSFREKIISQVDFSPSEIENLLKSILRELENNGYPFAEVKFTEIDFSDNVLHAHLKVIPHKKIVWTKINLKGEDVISLKMLQSYIRISEGDVYSQEILEKVSLKIKQIQFLEESAPNSVLFTTDGAELYLYLKSKQISSVNGVVGLQQNALTGKMMFTGDLKLRLVNVLKKAESFDLNWKSLQTQTQALNLNLTAPNLFKTSFGVIGSFNLYKRDTTFLEIKSKIGFQYALNNGGFVKAFYKNENSSLLSGAKNQSTLTNLSNVSTGFYGISLFKNNIDYLPNPSRGYKYELDASIGQRKYRQTDTSELSLSTTYKFEVLIDYYFSFAKRQVVRLANHSQVYIADKFFSNEVFRFGGQFVQRGFNEEVLLGTSLSVFTIEYRYQVDQNSFAFLFYDQSWYENKATNSFYTDRPFGMGAGFSFGTNLGIFSISYALGKQFDNPMLLRDGKIHFGYVSYF